MDVEVKNRQATIVIIAARVATWRARAPRAAAVARAEKQLQVAAKIVNRGK